MLFILSAGSKSSPEGGGGAAAGGEAESGTAAGRKRRWGSSTAVNAKKPSISITTDSLKVLYMAAHTHTHTYKQTGTHSEEEKNTLKIPVSIQTEHRFKVVTFKLIVLLSPPLLPVSDPRHQAQSGCCNGSPPRRQPAVWGRGHTHHQGGPGPGQRPEDQTHRHTGGGYMHKATVSHSG